MIEIVILCAGKGTRMLPLTKKVPKPLIEVNNKPFLSFLLENVLKITDKNHIFLIVKYLKEKIIKFINDNFKGINIVEQIPIPGTAPAILSVKPYIKEEKFLVLMGDNFYGYEDLIRFIKNNDNTIGVTLNDEPWKYGVVKIDSRNNVLEIREKPEKISIKPPEFISIGAYLFKKEVLNILNNIVHNWIKNKESSNQKECPITDLLIYLVKNKQLKAFNFKIWQDFGTIDDIEKMSKFLKKIKEGAINER